MRVGSQNMPSSIAVVLNYYTVTQYTHTHICVLKCSSVQDYSDLIMKNNSFRHASAITLTIVCVFKFWLFSFW